MHCLQCKKCSSIIKQDNRDCRYSSAQSRSNYLVSYVCELLHTSTCSIEYLVTINDEDTVLGHNLLHCRSSFIIVIYRRDACARIEALVSHDANVADGCVITIEAVVLTGYTYSCGVAVTLVRTVVATTFVNDVEVRLGSIV